MSVSGGDMPEAGKFSISACKSYSAIDSALQDASSIPDAAIVKIRNTLSEARFSKYMTMANDDKRLAMRLHSWNAAVAASLLPTLHVTEVAIRNFALRRLIAKYGKSWYSDYRLEAKLGKSPLRGQLADAVSDEKRAGRTSNLTDYVASELTFGFWVNVFTRTFVPELWTRPLHTINPNIPRDMPITDLHDGIELVRSFRNNVAHHKNLISKPVEANYERTLKVLSWVCKSSHQMAKTNSTFERVWACCPVPKERLNV